MQGIPLNQLSSQYLELVNLAQTFSSDTLATRRSIMTTVGLTQGNPTPISLLSFSDQCWVALRLTQPTIFCIILFNK
jgi:hypothetical protein